MEASLIKKHACSSTKESLENVIWVNVIITEILLVPLPVIIFSSMLIIDLSLLWVAQAGKGSRDLLKSILGIRCSVLVRVELKCEFPIRLLDFII